MGSLPEKLPLGWATASLEVLGIQKTTLIKPSESPETTFELWSVPAYPNDAPEMVKGKEVGSNKQSVIPEDVLLCKINPRINRVWLVGPKKDYPQIASTEWIVLRNKDIDSRFMMHRLREEKFRENLCANVSGVGGSLTRCRPQEVKKFVISLPPLNEQSRIVAKIEALQEKSNRAREALEAIPPLLEKFRQSVLASAFRGDLTAEWRAQNPDVEPASVLLEKIKKERRRLWEEAELAKMEAKGKTPKDDKWKKKYKEPEPVDKTDLPELPEGWCWASFEQCAWEITVGHVGPMKSRYVENGIPFLRCQNVRPYGYEQENLAYILEDFDEKLKKSRLYGGEILVVRSGVNVGDSCVYPTDAGQSNCSDLVITRPLTGLNPFFASLYVNSPFFKDALNLRKVGNAQPHFNVGSMKKAEIPVPSSEEQAVIVNKIQRLLDYSDNVKIRMLQANRLLDSQCQSILSKAFRGELIPQDPNDEPASVLLARIRAEREAKIGNKKGRGRRKK
ncbi:type I restriction enzyme, S subunit [Desulfatibacillum alkenivorans DSM 16219]|jgi:type I restriction enzyme S subunit|uniref:Type I restriction enzyme, S subunit n=1 Tax=Desulfatibacillum alkenivorans DSM 16219 TaxID=1121393 RepID=A0A1M6Q9J7_9BACT|nr:restriction endonuclease subunit S [Desulfatibacillum alkenivorans]SHK16828.1 type I restriction enzyme, S subunit [Desulfatibacillum alkenivorans DSM 16219]